MDAATLTIFNHLFASVAEEMGVTLNRAAYSPNIKERLDYSCAVFLSGEQPALLAQAAHIPVHLGAMPASVRAAVAACAPLRPGDVVILNDPYQGGNHLPDITLVSPVFIGGAGEQGSRGAGKRKIDAWLAASGARRQESARHFRKCQALRRRESARHCVYGKRRAHRGCARRSGEDGG